MLIYASLLFKEFPFYHKHMQFVPFHNYFETHLSNYNPIKYTLMNYLFLSDIHIPITHHTNHTLLNLCLTNTLKSRYLDKIFVNSHKTYKTVPFVTFTPVSLISMQIVSKLKFNVTHLSISTFILSS